jgi:hypothetical protein
MNSPQNACVFLTCFFSYETVADGDCHSPTYNLVTKFNGAICWAICTDLDACSADQRKKQKLYRLTNDAQGLIRITSGLN